jgi:inosose dehydratase
MTPDANRSGPLGPTGPYGGQLEVVASPVSWGVDYPGATDVAPPQSVLDEMRDLGFRALELGPLGYLPEDTATLRPLLGDRGLTSIGTWLLLPLASGPLTAEAWRLVDRTVGFISESGGRYLIIIDRLRHDYPKQTVQGVAWSTLLSNLEELIGAATSAGLIPVIHPHADTVVEHEGEIDELMAATAGSALGLCIDSGHCAYSGVDVDRLMAEHGSRVRLAHLKDVDGAVLAEAQAHGWPFWTAVARGVFCPLGQGVVDLARFLAHLVQARNVRYATLEHDRLPGDAAAPLADLRASLRTLAATGQALPTRPSPAPHDAPPPEAPRCR